MELTSRPNAATDTSSDPTTDNNHDIHNAFYSTTSEFLLAKITHSESVRYPLDAKLAETKATEDKNAEASSAKVASACTHGA
jgi:hypothetical protein